MNPFVRQIVERCHVGDTNREVIRYVISRIKGKYKTFRKLPREQRKQLLRDAVQCHRENRDLYCYVMRGLK